MKRAPFKLGFDVTFQQAINAAARRKAVLPSTFYDEIPEQMRSHAWSVTALATIDQVKAVLDSLNAKLKTGMTFQAWKTEALAADWAIPRTRLELLSRNHSQTAYMAGHWQKFESNKRTRPFLMYSAINDSRTRPTHRAMNGHIAAVGDPLWLTWSPPCGHNCRCSLISLTEQQARDRGLGGQSRPNVQPDKGWGHPPAEAGDRMRDMVSERAKEISPRMQSVMDKIMAGGYTFPPLTGAQRNFAAEKREVLRLAFGDQYAEWTDAQIWGMRQYATDSFPFNAFLRELSPRLDSEGLRDIVAIQDALKRFGDGVERTTFRGARSNPAFDKLAARAFVQGNVIRNEAFLSTSSRELGAEDFADKYVFTVRGKSGVNVDGFYTVNAENEYLFPTGTNFKVTSVRRIAEVLYVDLVETTERATFTFSIGGA